MLREHNPAAVLGGNVAEGFCDSDAIYVWRYDALCRYDKVLTHGKCPDADGLIPKRGAY